MKLSLLTEDLKQTIKVLKAKYPSQPILKISKKVSEQAIEWVAKSLSLDSGIWDEDAPRFLKEYENYFKNRGDQKYVSELKKIHPEYRNILNYTLHDLESASEIIDPQIQWSQDFRELPEGAELFREVPPYRMVKVTTPEAAVELAKGTKWCTSICDNQGNPTTARYYLSSGPLYVIFKNNQKIAQYHESNEPQLKNLQDKRHPESLSIVELLNLPIDKAILKNSESAFYFAFDVINGRWPEAEPYIMKNPEWAYNYANDVIGGRWPEAEPIIMNDRRWAYWYALNIDNSKWPEVEPMIIRDPEFAYRYARDVIKRRWPEAEQYIKQDHTWNYMWWNKYKQFLQSLND